MPDEAVGRVASVVSGDSLGIEILIADGADGGTNGVDSIKLADIATPSAITAQGKAARDYSSSLLKNKIVYFDINNNTTGNRNRWNQLICVIYLVDPEFRPLWPPVNRILVDGGFARLNDDPYNEFNSSAWWQQPPVFLPSKKRDMLSAMLEKQLEPEEMFFIGPIPTPAEKVPIESKSNTTNGTATASAAKVTVPSNATKTTLPPIAARIAPASNLAKEKTASSEIETVPASEIAKNALTSNLARGTHISDNIRETSVLGAKKVASALSATKGASASLVVPDNSTSEAANGTSLYSEVLVNSTSHIVMENATSPEVRINSTSLVKPGVPESRATKKDPRSMSILEKDKTSGRISIGYRK